MSTSEDHFSSKSAEYAAHRPTYPPELADFLAETAPRRELAWDVGCGSGQLSLLLADRFARVVAADSSREQIAHAAPHRNVSYRVASAEASGLEEHSVDLVVAAQSAHWFDLERFYAEVRRVARSGAVVALVTYGIVLLEAPLDRVVEPFYFDTLAGHWPPERRLVEEGYRSFAFPFRELECPRFEMRAEWNCDAFVGYVDTWSAVRSLERAGRRAEFDALAKDLARAWGSREVRRVIRWPLALRVGIV